MELVNLRIDYYNNVKDTMIDASTSTSSITTQRNVCLGAVGNIFIMIQKGVIAPWRTTSESCEYNFGCD